MKKVFATTLLFLLLIANASFAGETGLPIPRFVSIRSDEANLRTGPGTRYPIDWIYKQRGLPVEIINEYDTWRKIRDVVGDEGWVHQSMISGNRTALVTKNTRKIYAEADTNSAAIAKIEAGVIVQLDECLATWCEININGIEGWIPKVNLWGVYSHEQF